MAADRAVRHEDDIAILHPITDLARRQKIEPDDAVLLGILWRLCGGVYGLRSGLSCQSPRRAGRHEFTTIHRFAHGCSMFVAGSTISTVVSARTPIRCTRTPDG